MIASILGIIKSVLWLVTRFFKRKDDPATIEQKKRDEDSRIIAGHEASALNITLDDRLSKPTIKSDPE